MNFRPLIFDRFGSRKNFKSIAELGQRGIKHPFMQNIFDKNTFKHEYLRVKMPNTWFK